MLPSYDPNLKPLTRWERITSWFEEAEPIILLLCLFGGIILIFMLIVPKCQECDHYIHPMDVYCSNCGHQLRTTN